ncbi:MAG: sigma-E factor negative regulatory protein [Janthinobacterium lividum]
METNKKIREYISAFADGELPDADLELALAALRDADGRQTWDLYHRIGDALRAEPLEAEPAPGFALRLADRLAAEATPLRRPPTRPATAADALAAIAPAVTAGPESVGGGKMAGPGATPRDEPLPDTAPAAAKRL